MTLEEMTALIADKEWDDFTKSERGEIKLWPNALANYLRGAPVTFKMRVGLHMNRPTQAIIANGQFIRMRHTAEFEGYELKKLLAEDPDSCLYEQLVASVGKNSFVPEWRPIKHFIRWAGNLVVSNGFLSGIFGPGNVNDKTS